MSSAKQKNSFENRASGWEEGIFPALITRAASMADLCVDFVSFARRSQSDNSAVFVGCRHFCAAEFPLLRARKPMPAPTTSASIAGGSQRLAIRTVHSLRDAATSHSQAFAISGRIEPNRGENFSIAADKVLSACSFFWIHCLTSVLSASYVVTSFVISPRFTRAYVYVLRAAFNFFIHVKI